MKSSGKFPSSKSKTDKTSRVNPTVRSKSVAPKKIKQDEVAGPDERRPEVKADEIYGDTKIPERRGKP